MSKENSISIIIAIIIASFLAYYLLLCENMLHTSISEIIDFSQTLALTHHLIILGILPIYIAAMVFGAAMCGIYLGRTLNRLLLAFSSKN